MEPLEGLRNRKKPDGLFEAFSERLEDSVTSEPLTQAVTLNCGHSYNESTIVSLGKQGRSKYLCPECRTPIQSYQPSYALRDLAESIALLPPPSESQEENAPRQEEESNARQEEAQAHLQRGRTLFDQGLQEESVAAILKALEINPNFEKALDFLDFITDPKRNPKPLPQTAPLRQTVDKVAESPSSNQIIDIKTLIAKAGSIITPELIRSFGIDRIQEKYVEISEKIIRVQNGDNSITNIELTGDISSLVKFPLSSLGNPKRIQGYDELCKIYEELTRLYQQKLAELQFRPSAPEIGRRGFSRAPGIIETSSSRQAFPLTESSQKTFGMGDHNGNDNNAVSSSTSHFHNADESFARTFIPSVKPVEIRPIPLLPYQIACDAIVSNNQELFLSAAKEIEDWSIVLPSGDNLVHCAAVSLNLFFLNFIIRKASRECLSAACNKYNSKGFLPIHCAAASGSILCLNTLLQVSPYSANANTKEFETPIFVAVANNHPACIEPLCAAGANLALRGKGGVTPLMKAIESHYQSCIREILRMSTEISKDTLHLVMEMQITRLFKTLLDRGIDVNLMGVTGEEGYCPLHVAVRLGWLDGVKILAQNAGIKLNAECLWGKTALDYAIEGNHYQIGEYLIQKKAVSKRNYSILWFRIWNARSFISRWFWGSDSMYEINLPPLKMSKSSGIKMELFSNVKDP